MNRSEYLEQVIHWYLNRPDTPRKARRTDWAVAGNFYQRQIPLPIVRLAIQTAEVRRRLRDPELEKFGPLEPIQSLAYFRPIINYLLKNDIDQGYLDYVDQKYRQVVGK